MFAVLTSILSFGQDVVGNNIVIGEGSIRAKHIEGEKSSTEGSPYFNEVFLESEIVSYNQPLSLRYNAATDDMEFQQNGQLYSLQKDVYSTVYLGPQKIKYVYTDYKNGSKSEKGFLSLVAENNNVAIYKKESIKLIDAKIASSSYEKSTPPIYKKQMPEFYIEKDDQIVNIPKNKKKFSKFFGSDSERILKIIDSNNIDLENEISLKHFIDKL